MKLVESLKWRYATKKFNGDKKISKEQLSYLKEAVRLSVSSFGLQLYKILVVSDPNIKKQLQPLCDNQEQIASCSHLFIFCNYKVVDNTLLDRRGPFVKGWILQKTQPEQKSWLERQPYLAVSNLLMACAEQKIDACPIEGFSIDDINHYFDLDHKNLNAVVMVATGYRADDDMAQHRTKVRKSEEDLFETFVKMNY